MKVLVLNCGSSSIKYQLLDMQAEAELLAKGLVERIGLPEGVLTHKGPHCKSLELNQPIPDHTVGIKIILDILVAPETGVINNLNEIDAVGHRVAHGGEYFDQSAFITTEARKNIENCCSLAPLHNPANLKGIDAMITLLPGIPQVAVFDTSFHQTMPEYAFFYPLPYEYYEKYKIRRYGFHGTSHKFVAEKACKALNWDIKERKIITCHLGNGASICAIDKGISVDTSMGFTPVEGLMMGTRVGDLDLGAILHIMKADNIDVESANNLVNKKSGLQGFSGVSSDMRDLMEAGKKGNKRADVAIEMFAYRVRKYIGSYVAAMNGIDLIIFTGGIGENAWPVRERIASHLGYLGAHFDSNLNENTRGIDGTISTPDSKVKIMVVTTNEELVIARDTLRIVSAMKVK
ncbi:MAG TPA: acetate kinase [Bacteroidales bacterium]|nr:acetate kinase [Bacteroidales bacterium]